MLLRRRQKGGPMGADPLCASDALRAAWVTRQVECVPVLERTPGRPSSTPFFTDDDGVSAWSTGTSRRLAQRMTQACGEDPGALGGKCWRIGGATDLRD
eukprot:4844813-Pleurochrysis_carterae.AAC.2